MFTYLGEDAREFKSLVNEKITENELQKFEISNEKGSFSGMKANLNGVEGYAYYHTNGSFYEFASEDVCSVTPSETLKIAKKEIVQFQKTEKAFLENRDEETKKINTHKISFVDNSLHSKQAEATSAKINGVDGFIFREKTLGAFSASQDVVKNYFVSKADVQDLGIVSQRSLLTFSEQNEIRERELQKLFDEKLDVLKEYGVSVSDPKKGSFIFDHTVSKIKNLELTKEEITGEYTTKELMEKVNAISVEKETLKVDSELKSFGIGVKFIEDFKNDSLSIVVSNKNGKEISKLSLTGVIHESVDMTVNNPVGKYLEPEEMSFEMVVFDLENESELENKKLEIKENGRTVSLEKSKFTELYETFDHQAFMLDHHSDLDEYENVSTIDGNEFERSDLEITDELSFKSYVLDKIKEEPELRKELKAALKSSNKLKR